MNTNTQNIVHLTLTWEKQKIKFLTECEDMAVWLEMTDERTSGG